MPLNRLQRDFEERRQQLVQTLQRGKEGLELSKQHQIYGAIKEIENFLKAVDYQRELQLRGDDFELTREGPKPIAKRTSLAMDRFSKGTKDFFRNASVVFNQRVVQRTGNAVKSTKHRLKLWRDVAKEVKQRAEPKQATQGPGQQGHEAKQGKEPEKQ